MKRGSRDRHEGADKAPGETRGGAGASPDSPRKAVGGRRLGQSGARTAGPAQRGAGEGSDVVDPAAFERAQLFLATLEDLKVPRVLAVGDVHVAEFDLDEIEQHFDGTL